MPTHYRQTIGEAFDNAPDSLVNQLSPGFRPNLGATTSAFTGAPNTARNALVGPALDRSTPTPVGGNPFTDPTLQPLPTSRNAFGRPTGGELASHVTEQVGNAATPVINPVTGIANPEFHAGGTQFQPGPQLAATDPVNATTALTRTTPDQVLTPDEVLPPSTGGFVAAGTERPTFMDTLAQGFELTGGPAKTFASAIYQNRFAGDFATKQLASLQANEAADVTERELQGTLAKQDAEIAAKQAQGGLSASDYKSMQTPVSKIQDPTGLDTGVLIGTTQLVGEDYTMWEAERAEVLREMRESKEFEGAPDSFIENRADVEAARAVSTMRAEGALGVAPTGTVSGRAAFNGNGASGGF